MTVSPKRQTRSALSRNREQKIAKQSWMKRQLKLETLESRQLMAADVMPFHNYLVPTDVNGDFAVTPLDALVVINKLNNEGSGSLENHPARDGFTDYFDVDGDNYLSPLDALTIINAINSGEGLGELAEVRYRFFSVKDDGTIGDELIDPNPNNGITEAIIGTGDRVIVRTQMKDLRSPNPQGVFSAYHDMTFKNADNSADEKLQLQWGEFNQLDIQNNVTGGTFTIRYGTETTAPISVAFVNSAFSATQTAANIRNAIQALPSVGTNNVRVVPISGNNTGTLRFGISFINDRARTNIVNPVIANNSLTAPNSASVSLTITGQDNPNPGEDASARAARNHNIDNGTFDSGNGPIPIARYTNGPGGVLTQSTTDPSLRTMSLLGGFSNSSNFFDPTVASQFLSIVDVLFEGAEAGQIDFRGKTSPLPGAGQSGDNLGIALYGEQARYLDDSLVILPLATLIISDRLTAVTDTLTITEDAPATTINVVQNDIDRTNATSRSVLDVTQPATGGSVTFSGSNVTFTPTPDFSGTVQFTYRVRNNATPTPDTATGTVIITVTPVNDPPVVVTPQPALTIAEDTTTPLVITPSQLFTPGPANESTQTLSFRTVSSGPQTNGTVTIVGGNINFVPAPNFFGNAIFTVVAEDNGSPVATATATVTVTVTPVNDAPVAPNASYTTTEDGSFILSGTGAPDDLLTKGNPGPGESNQTIRIVSFGTPSAGGTVTAAGTVFTYRPAANFFGTETITYTIEDNGTPALTATGTVTMTVTPVNDAPIAVNDTGAARFTVLGLVQPNNLNVMANDSAGPLETTDTIKIVSVTTPSRGTATINAAGDRVVYTPPANSFNTTATFSYTIEDSAGLRSTANVEVFIIPPVLPFAADDAATMDEDGANITIDVLANDIANGAAAIMTLESFTQPAAGTGSVTLDDKGTASKADDELIYDAPADFFGTATFTYTMTDNGSGSQPSTGTVVVTVNPVNDAPVAVNKSTSGVEDTVLTVQGSFITSGLSKGPGEDAQTLTVTAAVNQTPNSGTVAVTGGNIVYTPAANFNGQVLVLYTVTDNGTPALSSSATLTITVAPVNDAPIPGADPTVVTAEDTPATITISGLLANDSPGPADESSQTVSFVALTGPITTVNGGTVTQSNGNLIYTPAANFNGSDSFTYQITDGQSANAVATATLTLRVTEVNDAPVASTISKTAFASVATTFDLTSELAQMSRGAANESGQTLRINRVIPGAGTRGTVVLNANGTITYTAPAGSSGTDSFTFEVIDNGTTNGVADPKTAIGTFNVNIAAFVPSTITGTVFIDDNNTGVSVIDTHELRIGGVEVTLSIPANGTEPARTIVKQTRTDGTYSFDLLPPGTYTVSYAVPLLMVDGPSPNSFTHTLVAPGGNTIVSNFAVVGVVPSYGNLLESLASNYYMTDAGLRSSGIYSAVDATGKTAWTIARNGFTGSSFQEVVLSDDGTRAYVSEVRGANHTVHTAVLNKNQFVSVEDKSGNRLIRVLARAEDLAWTEVSLAAPPVEIADKAKAYLDTVDELFAQEGW